MSNREQRPKEFGLKVREHPGAMIITAKNKMGAAETEVRSQDLWGQVQRRFRFRKAAETNNRNLEFSRQFVSGLVDSRRNSEYSTIDEASAARLLHDVDYSDVVNFIGGMNLPEDDLGDDALVRHLRSMEKSGLPKPKVLVFNQARSGTPKWERTLTEIERQFINTPYKFIDGIDIRLAKRRMDQIHEEYRVKSVHLGNPDDEKLFLSPAQRESVRALVTRDPISFDYMCSDARDFAGLIIYLFAVAVPDENNGVSKESGKFVLGHGRLPTVGYTLSIPRSDSLKGMTKTEIDALIKATKHSYQVNKIHSRLQQVSAYEEIDDDDEF